MNFFKNIYKKIFGNLKRERNTASISRVSIAFDWYAILLIFFIILIFSVYDSYSSYKDAKEFIVDITKKEDNRLTPINSKDLKGAILKRESAISNINKVDKDSSTVEEEGQ